MNKKIIAVMGATGAQGGGVAHAILKDKDSEFAVRAITRDPNSAKAVELAKLGAEVVSADLADAGSVKRAMEGAYGAYCVTFFWAHMSPDTEKAHARVLAESAKAAGVEHAIWSTFEDTRDLVPLDDDRMPTLQGHYKVPHFDAKAEANTYFTDVDVPVTFLLTSWYFDNLIHFGSGPQRDKNGKLAFTLPLGDKKLPAIAAADIGGCAYGIFKQGRKYISRTVGVASEHLTGKEMAASLARALGEPVYYNEVSPDVYRSFGFPGADDVGNMFQYKAEFEAQYCGNRNLAESRSLNPEMQTFDQWLAKNASLIPIK